MKHLWEVEHSYYCSESNYYNTNEPEHYKSLSSFLEEWDDANPDYNLIFRWDWNLTEEKLKEFDDNYRGYTLYIFWMGQRKGLYQCTTIEVCRADEPKVIEYLNPRWKYLKELWKPFE